MRIDLMSQVLMIGPFCGCKLIKTHTKFVQDLEFSPSGDLFASVGSDSKIFLYDGKTGETVAEVNDSPHKGTIVGHSLSAFGAY